MRNHIHLHICLVLFLFLSIRVEAQVQIGIGVPEFSLNANATAAPQVGTVYSMPGAANLVTWNVTFASAPASQTTILETSNDNSAWATADTTTNVAGESRTVFTAARFIRSTESARSGGGAITVTFVVKSSANPVPTIATATRINFGASSAVLPAIRVSLLVPGIDIVSTDDSVFAHISAAQVNPNSGINIGATGYVGWNTRTYMYSSSNGNIRWSNFADTFGVVYEVSGAPTLGACGTATISADSTNTSGTVTLTAGTPATCAVNFSVTWTKAPRCTVNMMTVTAADTRAIGTSTTTTVLTVTPSAAFAASTAFVYHCESSR